MKLFLSLVAALMIFTALSTPSEARHYGEYRGYYYGRPRYHYYAPPRSYCPYDRYHYGPQPPRRHGYEFRYYYRY